MHIFNTQASHLCMTARLHADIKANHQRDMVMSALQVGRGRVLTLVQASAMMAMRQLSSTMLMENLQSNPRQGMPQLCMAPHTPDAFCAFPCGILEGIQVLTQARRGGVTHTVPD